MHNLRRSCFNAAETTADDAWMPAFVEQLLGKPERERSFTAAADRDVSNHDNRNREFLAGQNTAAVKFTAQCHQQTKNKTERQQEDMQRGDAVPVSFQPVHPVSMPLLPAGGKGDTAVTGDTGGFHDVDDRLVGGLCVGVDNDGRVLLFSSRFEQYLR